MRLVWQVFYLLDRKQNGVIDFGEFVRSLSVFHPKARVQDKIQCRTFLLERIDEPQANPVFSLFGHWT